MLAGLEDWAAVDRCWAGLYPFSAFSAGVLVRWLGYTSFITAPDAIPTTAFMGALAVLSYAILAPLCEEFLFRGIIQPVYETRGARWGVLWVGLLFVAFHLSLLQGLSILLLALALGYVNYRTRSLPASMLTHFGANGLAALVVTQQVFPTGIETWITTMPALIGGLALAGAALVGLIRLTPQLAVEASDWDVPPAEVTPRPARRARLTVAWPLMAALAIYLPVIGMEWAFSHSPAATESPAVLSPALEIGPSPWAEAHAWRYEIRNIADEAVGEGMCSLEPIGEEITITCDSAVREYEVKQGQSTYASSGGRRIDVLHWQRTGSSILSGSSTLDLEGGFGSEVAYQRGEDRLEVRYQERGKDQVQLDLPYSETTLAQDPGLPVAVEYLWPWHLAGLKRAPGEQGSVLHFNAYTWLDEARGSGPRAEPRLLKVSAPEEVQTVVGTFSAWLVSCGDREQVWYAEISGVLVVVKYFNGIETWILMP